MRGKISIKKSGSGVAKVWKVKSTLWKRPEYFATKKTAETFVKRYKKSGKKTVSYKRG